MRSHVALLPVYLSANDNAVIFYIRHCSLRHAVCRKIKQGDVLAVYYNFKLL